MTGHKLSSDLIWNYLSVGITAVCGAAFSIIISFFYPENILGRFNTVYSYYIVMSQFCVCGIHMAIVKYSAEKKYEATGILIKAIIITAWIASIMSGVFYCVINLGLRPFIGDSMVTSFNTIIISLILFSLNKVFLGWLNGKMLMKAYAFFQTIRNVVIALSLIVFSLMRIEGEKLTYCFLVAEIVVSFFSIAYIILFKKHFYLSKTEISAKELLWFGVRILPSNAIMELNTKIDVICLGLLLHNESLVGVYSFAAMFAEGFYQLVVVLRKIINPHIAMEYAKGELNKYILAFKNKYMIAIYALFSVGYVLLLSAYRVLVYLIGKESYYAGTIVLAIVCACIVLNTKMIVFGNILAQTGNPGRESMANIIATASNACLNFILIYFFGVLGAAIATGISYFVYGILQKQFLKSRTNIVL